MTVIQVPLCLNNHIQHSVKFVELNELVTSCETRLRQNE